MPVEHPVRQYQEVTMKQSEFKREVFSQATKSPSENEWSTHMCIYITFVCVIFSIIHASLFSRKDPWLSLNL